MTTNKRVNRAEGVSATGLIDMEDQDEEAREEYEEEEDSSNRIASQMAKRLRMANQLVNSIDAALERTNYDPMPLPAPR